MDSKKRFIPRDYYAASGHLMHNSIALQQATLTMGDYNPKARDIFTDWVGDRAELMVEETTWRTILEKPYKDRDAAENKFTSGYEFGYELGDVILVDLGYNVGHEYGGAHFCVVMKKARRSDTGVIVIPLTSSTPNQNPMNQEKHYSLGEIDFLNTDPTKENKTSYAKLSCVIQVSKIRIMNNRKIKGKLNRTLFRSLEKEFLGYLSPYMKHEDTVMNQRINRLEKENQKLLKKIELLENKD